MNVDIKGQECRIRWIHCRIEDDSGKTLPRGGETIAYILNDKGKRISGHAYCSVKDTYNKKLGRTIATGRLLKSLGLNTKLAISC